MCCDVMRCGGVTWHKVPGVHTLKELHLAPVAVLVREELADDWCVAAPALGREDKGVAAAHLPSLQHILACKQSHFSATALMMMMINATSLQPPALRKLKITACMLRAVQYSVSRHVAQAELQHDNGPSAFVLQMSTMHS